MTCCIYYLSMLSSSVIVLGVPVGRIHDTHGYSPGTVRTDTNCWIQMGRTVLIQLGLHKLFIDTQTETDIHKQPINQCFPFEATDLLIAPIDCLKRSGAINLSLA